MSTATLPTSDSGPSPSGAGGSSEGSSGILDSVKSFLNHRITVYVTRRIITMIPLFLGISMLTFGMLRFLGEPTDALVIRGPARDLIIQNLREKFGLTEPLHVQYFIWLKGFLTWDFGYSIVFQTFDPTQQINDLIVQTLKLQYLALFFSVIISIPLGILAARRHQTTLDTGISTFALLGVSMPVFVLGIGLILLSRRLDFTLQLFGATIDFSLGWLPVSGAYETNREVVYLGQVFNNPDVYWPLWRAQVMDEIIHLILPVFTLTIVQLALVTRLMRSNMLETLGEDYILAARANGLSERAVIWKHALRNAIIPIITFVAIAFGTALAGSPITETVFSWPGLGKFYIRAIFTLDMVLVLAITMIITVLILVFNLVADVLYVVVDPRIKL